MVLAAKKIHTIIQCGPCCNSARRDGGGMRIIFHYPCCLCDTGAYHWALASIIAL